MVNHIWHVKQVWKDYKESLDSILRPKISCKEDQTHDSETAKYMQMLRCYFALPDDEIDDIVEFYSEYLADAGIDTSEIEQELGTPRQLALKILVDHSIKEEAEDQRVVSKPRSRQHG